MVMMSTVKEVSRGAQTSGLVRNTTVKTGQSQTPLLGSSTNVAEVWRIPPLVSLPPSFRVAGSLTRSQYLPAALPKEADPRSTDMAMSIAHWDPPRFLLDPINSPRFSSDTHAPTRKTAESARAASREATHWESIPPGTRPTRSFRSQTSR